jgi:hypothetical protein
MDCTTRAVYYGDEYAGCQLTRADGTQVWYYWYELTELGCETQCDGPGAQ